MHASGRSSFNGTASHVSPLSGIGACHGRLQITTGNPKPSRHCEVFLDPRLMACHLHLYPLFITLLFTWSEGQEGTWLEAAQRLLGCTDRAGLLAGTAFQPLSVMSLSVLAHCGQGLYAPSWCPKQL